MSSPGEEYTFPLVRTPQLWELMCEVATPTTFDGEKSKLCCDPSTMGALKKALNATPLQMFVAIDDFEVLTVERKTEGTIVFDIYLRRDKLNCLGLGIPGRRIEGLELHNPNCCI